MVLIADLGGVPGARPTQGSRFFRFDIQNFRNVTASGVHAPTYEVHAPIREIPDSPIRLSYHPQHSGLYGKFWIRHDNETTYLSFHCTELVSNPMGSWKYLNNDKVEATISFKGLYV